LVEAPEGRAYICRSCAQIALNVITHHQARYRLGPAAKYLIIAAIGLAVLNAIFDEPQDVVWIVAGGMLLLGTIGAIVSLVARRR
jgi:hypothetical protein